MSELDALREEIERLKDALGTVCALDAEDYTPQEAAHAFDRAVTVAYEALNASEPSVSRLSDGEK